MSPLSIYRNIAGVLIAKYLLSQPIETHAFIMSSSSRSGRIGMAIGRSPNLTSNSSSLKGFHSALHVINSHVREGVRVSMELAATPTTRIGDMKYEIEELSQDPKCFLVHNFLTSDECQKYITKADTTEPELMTQSNAPEVSLQIERLWPLPFLCLGAGIPPFIRLLQGMDTNKENLKLDDILSAVLPPVAIALGVTTALIFAIQKLVSIYAQTSSRTSVSLALNTEEDCDFIRTLVDRASDITNHKWSSWEAPVITKYEKDAVFASHNDASPTKGSEWADLGGQRVVTVITYLNTCHEGGGTKFDQLGFTVQPKEGSALIFYPADGETLEADGRTVHQSLPAVDQKYIVQLFGRYRRVPSPLGIPASYSIES